MGGAAVIEDTIDPVSPGAGAQTAGNTTTSQGSSVRIDTGLSSLVMIARFHGVAADPAQIKHAFAIGDHGMQTLDIIRAAKELGFKAKSATVTYEKLPKLTFPAIAEIKTGKDKDRQEAIGTRQEETEFIIFAKVENGQVLALHPAETTPRILKQEDLEKVWTGKLILLSQRGFLSREEKFGLKWFLPSIWKYRKPLAEVLIASFVLQIFALVTPIFTQVIIDKVLVHRGLTTLDVLAIGLLTIALFEGALNILRTYVFTHTTSRIDVNLGVRLFRHLFALPLRYFEVRRVGDTIARVRELENIRHFLTGSPLTLVLDLMFVFVAVMLFYSVKLTLAALVALPLFALLSYLVTPMLRHRLDEKFNRGADSQSYLVEAVSGVQTVKSFALEPEAQKKWEGLLSKYITSSFKTYQLSGIANAIGTFINRASYLVILWYGAHLVMDGDLTVGMLIAFQMLSGRVSDPVLRLVQMWQDFQQIGISLQRLGDIFNAKPEPAMDASKARLPAVQGHIRMEAVRFRYRVDGPEILRNVAFDIPAGTTVAIVGRSGSGKSTLAKLLQRLYIEMVPGIRTVV